MNVVAEESDVEGMPLLNLDVYAYTAPHTVDVSAPVAAQKPPRLTLNVPILIEVVGPVAVGRDDRGVQYVAHLHIDVWLRHLTLVLQGQAAFQMQHIAGGLV